MCTYSNSYSNSNLNTYEYMYIVYTATCTVGLLYTEYIKTYEASCISRIDIYHLTCRGDFGADGDADGDGDG